MPELPEVETIRRQLSPALKGAKIIGVQVRFAKRISPGKAKFIKDLTGNKILGVERRAKVLMFNLSGDLTMLVHLKMTGRLLLKNKGEKPTKHTHVVFSLSGGRELHFEDLRKFGFLKLMTNKEAKKWLEDHKFGPEPLKADFGWQHFAQCLRRKPSAKIKPWLMDPTCVVGIGNIYATEALWRAKIHPLTPVKKLSDAQIKKLYSAIITELKQALKDRGTSADDYLDAFGEPGAHDRKLKAYGRAGEKCSRCGTKMEKIKVAARGTTLCPKCQR
ncbi:bifunctional DNA-formamidopyrimidine glycosylase/DNA-(apurinic or apyrimidinic site) lyase [Patescibacteria group bacterium]|nr:bifunctional DNA-formamidopyrimidine glycosylase/DNA-(apurinic or apyrimidinic site) lyase [Patescibacteria group bacterium]